MRDYFGLINGTIPRFITDELPFEDMCCEFTGYMPRYARCGCCAYELDDYDEPLLNTECKYNGDHEDIEFDTSFARWSVDKSRIPEICQHIKDIEINIPINAYVFYDKEDHEIYFRNTDALDSLSRETNYQIFKWAILVSIFEAFYRYQIQSKITFTSECA